MPPQFPALGRSQPLNLLSLLQNLPVASSYSKNGVCSTCPYSFSAKGPMTYKKQHKSKLKPHRNPYREAQAKQRKSANIARQKLLQEQRANAMGDPVRSVNTPFIESLSTGMMPDEPNQEELRNFFLGPKELTQALDYSKKLSAPYMPIKSKSSQSRQLLEPPASADVASPHSDPFEEARSSSDPPILPIERGDARPPPTLTEISSVRSKANDLTSEQISTLHKVGHQNAVRALSLITSLSNGSSADRSRLNIQRCISTFGRQSTDALLPPRPASIYNTNARAPKLRAGPDTGSSEVQIAVLTTKINVLASNLHNKDKINKRNLRLMVHKRQKLLQYLRRKERGGPRWQNLVETLGIQDAMWKGEISL